MYASQYASGVKSMVWSRPWSALIAKADKVAFYLWLFAAVVKMEKVRLSINPHDKTTIDGKALSNIVLLVI